MGKVVRLLGVGWERPGGPGGTPTRERALRDLSAGAQGLRAGPPTCAMTTLLRHDAEPPRPPERRAAGRCGATRRRADAPAAAPPPPPRAGAAPRASGRSSSTSLAARGRASGSASRSASTVTAESAGSLQRAGRHRHRARAPRRPARRLRDGRRRAARRARAAARARDRPGPARRLAPQARARGRCTCCSRTRVLITVGYARQAHDGVLHQFGQLLWTYPGILAATVGVVAAVRRRRHLLPARAPADGLRDVVVGAPLHLPRAVPVVLAPGRHRRVVRRPSRRALLVDGAVARDARARRRRARRAAAVALAAPPVRVVGVDAGGPGVVSILLRGRRLDRLPVAGGQFLQWRFLRRGLWWQAHPYSLSAAPAGDLLRITVKDLGDHSAGLAPPAARARAVAIEGPYGDLHRRHAPSATACCSSAPASAPRRSSRCCRSCPRTPTSPSCCARSTREDLVLRDEVAAEVAAPRRAPARARRVARRGARSTPPRCAGSSPTCAAATSTCAVRTRSRASSPPSSSAPACPSAASTSSPSPSETEPMMRRAPIVLAATVAGTAGVLAFHAAHADGPDRDRGRRGDDAAAATTPTATTSRHVDERRGARRPAPRPARRSPRSTAPPRSG